MEIQRINPREWNCSAAVFGDLVFLSGTVADDKSLDMKGQTAQVLQKIDEVLAKAGTNKSRILSATVYMADAKSQRFNERGLDGVGGSIEPADAHCRRCRVDPGNDGRDHRVRREIIRLARR